MGYMGFGMRKEVYTRKPKTSFSKVRKIYGDHLEDFQRSKKGIQAKSEKEKEDFKSEFAKKTKGDNLIWKMLKVIAILAVLAFIAWALILQWELWENHY
jgi:hypothetical protein